MDRRHGAHDQPEARTSIPHVLIVDDDADIREVVDLIFREDGFTTSTCSTAKAALSILQSQHVDLLVTDLRLPGGNGGGLIRHIAALSEPRPKVILLTAMRAGGPPGELAELHALGGRVVNKPFDVEVLLVAARELTGWPGPGSQ